MCRRLFVHLDAPAPSARVLKQALDIARRTQCDIRFFYRATRRTGTDSTAGFVGSPSEWLEVARSVGAAALQGALEMSLDTGSACDAVFSEGPDDAALQAVREAAEAWGADLVVMADLDARARALLAPGGHAAPRPPAHALTVLLVGCKAADAPSAPARITLRWVDFDDLDDILGVQYLRAVEPGPHPALRVSGLRGGTPFAAS